MKTVYPIIALIATLMFSSCFKEDEKVPPHDPGELKTTTIELTQDYRYQVYYDLGDEAVVSSNLKKDWDLGFDCTPGSTRIILNTSNFMLAARSGSSDFDAPIDTSGYQWIFDASSGNPDTAAFGDWVEFQPPDSTKSYSGEVYVIDRGYDEAGNLRGYRKIVFESMENDQFTIRYANLDGTGEARFTVTKVPSVNFTYFTFENGGSQLTLEPPADSWDLVFTQYTTLLYTDEGDPYPYLVTGVLLNPAGVEVVQDTLNDFLLIDRDLASSLVYTNVPDEIGYDWKDIVGDVSTGNVSYVIVEGLHYLVRDPEGFYYKMRFISFYSGSGEKGYPTFEFQRL
jgi:hypothetical protein